MNARHRNPTRLPLWLTTALITGLASGNVNAGHWFAPDDLPPYPMVQPAPRPPHFARHHPVAGLLIFPGDAEAAKYLGLTHITLRLLDQMSEHQRQLHLQAMAEASRADENEEIVWEDGKRSGSAKTIRIGHTGSGKECRQFEQKVTIEGKSEVVRGTACRQADGSWRMLNHAG